MKLLPKSHSLGSTPVQYCTVELHNVFKPIIYSSPRRNDRPPTQPVIQCKKPNSIASKSTSNVSQCWFSYNTGCQMLMSVMLRLPSWYFLIVGLSIGHMSTSRVSVHLLKGWQSIVDTMLVPSPLYSIAVLLYFVSLLFKRLEKICKKKVVPIIPPVKPGKVNMTGAFKLVKNDSWWLLGSSGVPWALQHAADQVHPVHCFIHCGNTITIHIHGIIEFHKQCTKLMVPPKKWIFMDKYFKMLLPIWIAVMEFACIKRLWQRITIPLLPGSFLRIACHWQWPAEPSFLMVQNLLNPYNCLSESSEHNTHLYLGMKWAHQQANNRHLTWLPSLAFLGRAYFWASSFSFPISCLHTWIASMG